MRKKKDDEVFSRNGCNFKQAFPMLDDAVLVYKEFDSTGLIRAGVHSLQRLGHIVVCSNSRCHEGGYDLQPEIKRMMSRKSKRKAIFLQCEGSETNGPRSEEACTGSIEGTLVLKMNNTGIAVQSKAT